MADSEPSMLCGSDLDQMDVEESAYKQAKSRGMLRLGSVRALAIKKGVLTHEVDEGSPCLRCGDNCVGFSLHFWRKVCKNCLCQREEHDIRDDSKEDTGAHVGKLLFSPSVDTFMKNSTGAIRMTMAHEISLSPTPSRRPLNFIVGQDCQQINDKYVWVPGSCSVDAVRAYFEALPANKQPIRKTPGERYRQKQLIRQLPAHDLDMFYCNNLSEEESKQMDIFIRMRKENSLGKAIVRVKSPAERASRWVCGKCQGSLSVGEVAVFTDRGGSLLCWHPSCFTCYECLELLVDLIYFYNEKDGMIYCGRHHAEKIKPRCAACDELIFCREYTNAEDSDWHLDHFCCLHCDVGLGGQQYRAQDKSPFCLTCYEASFITSCQTCGECIGMRDPRLTHGEYAWHGKDSCFHCALCKVCIIVEQWWRKGGLHQVYHFEESCFEPHQKVVASPRSTTSYINKSLIDKPFLPKHGKVFCSKNHAKEFRSKSKHR